MQKIKDSFFLILGLIIIVGSLFFSFKSFFTSSVESVTLEIGGVNINAEVVHTPEFRAQGLSGRESLSEGAGMLFVFEETNEHGFWMKDMRFSIDIVWIDESSQVISVERNVRPETFPKIFYPPRPIKYVLELSSGESQKLGIDIGDLVYLK